MGSHEGSFDMRVLVIGGTGLISTAIVNRLLAKGHEPVLFNRGESAARLDGDVETVLVDRSDHEAFATAAGNVSVDAVIDMLTFDAEVAAQNVALFQGRVAHYLFCSTVCVYGGPLTQIPAVESEPRTPVSAYGQGKLDAEDVFLEAHAKSGFPLTMFRPSHCYGPGAALLDIWGYDASLVSRFRAGQSIVVAGDGHGLWQPGHVDDMAKGFVGALGRDVCIGKAYNIVGDEVMTWRVFHERMAEALGLEAKLVTLTTEQIVAGTPDGNAEWLNENFQYHAAYSGAALEADVPDYCDLMSWEDGVRDTVAWMDANDIHEAPDAKPWVDTLVKSSGEILDRLQGRG
jgi:nucleoside-diphosphate-sugar epimerase